MSKKLYWTACALLLCAQSPLQLQAWSIMQQKPTPTLAPSFLGKLAFWHAPEPTTGQKIKQQLASAKEFVIAHKKPIARGALCTAGFLGSYAAYKALRNQQEPALAQESARRSTFLLDQPQHNNGPNNTDPSRMTKELFTLLEFIRDCSWLIIATLWGTNYTYHFYAEYPIWDTTAYPTSEQAEFRQTMLNLGMTNPPTVYYGSTNACARPTANAIIIPHFNQIADLLGFSGDHSLINNMQHMLLLHACGQLRHGAPIIQVPLRAGLLWLATRCAQAPINFAKNRYEYQPHQYRPSDFGILVGETAYSVLAGLFAHTALGIGISRSATYSADLYATHYARNNKDLIAYKTYLKALADKQKTSLQNTLSAGLHTTSKSYGESIILLLQNILNPWLPTPQARIKSILLSTK